MASQVLPFHTDLGEHVDSETLEHACRATSSLSLAGTPATRLAIRKRVWLIFADGRREALSALYGQLERR